MSEIPTDIGHEGGESGDVAGFFVPTKSGAVIDFAERRQQRQRELTTQAVRSAIKQAVAEISEEIIDFSDDETTLRCFMAQFVRHPSNASTHGNDLGEKLREQFASDDKLGEALQRMATDPDDDSDLLAVLETEDDVFAMIEDALRTSRDRAAHIPDARKALMLLREFRAYAYEQLEPVDRDDESWKVLVDRLIGDGA